MTRGFYSAASAMMAELDRFESISNNLANVNTRGYKRHQTVHHDFQRGFLERVNTRRQDLRLPSDGSVETVAVNERPRNIGELGTGTLAISSWTDFRNGSLQETGNPFDLALQGDGLFSVRNAQGETLYTRSGAFQRDSAGYLVTARGEQVLSMQGNPIRLANNDQIAIGEDGSLRVNGQSRERLALVSFANPQLLQNRGDNLYAAPPGVLEQDATPLVKAGYLEQSNVDVASEMVTMISALRAYQIGQKALQSEDEMTSRLINEVGRPSA
ncbi:MAG: flagellar basal-body rod protein FlgF [Candidatus Sericytochromatia bacterium]